MSILMKEVEDEPRSEKGHFDNTWDFLLFQYYNERKKIRRRMNRV